MLNKEKLLRAKEMWQAVPEHQFNLNAITSVGGNSTSSKTVACPIGWAIRHPDFQLSPYQLSKDGSVLVNDKDGGVENTYGYIAALFDMPYLEAIFLCRGRRNAYWTPYGDPEPQEWSDKETFMHRLEAVLAGPDNAAGPYFYDQGFHSYKYMAPALAE